MLPMLLSDIPRAYAGCASLTLPSSEARLSIAEYTSRSTSAIPAGQSPASRNRAQESVQTAFAVLQQRFNEERGMYRCCSEAAASMTVGTGSDDYATMMPSLISTAASQPQSQQVTPSPLHPGGHSFEQESLVSHVCVSV